MVEFIENPDGEHEDDGHSAPPSPPPSQHVPPSPQASPPRRITQSEETTPRPPKHDRQSPKHESSAAEHDAPSTESTPQNDQDASPSEQAASPFEREIEPAEQQAQSSEQQAQSSDDESEPPPASSTASPPSPHDALSAMVDVLETERSLQAAFDAQQLAHMYELLQVALQNTHVFVSSDDHGAKGEEWVRRALTIELAATLRLSERKITAMLADAEALCEQFPRTLEALSRGAISYQHAKVMVGESVGLDDDARTDYESEALQTARQTTPPQFKKAAISIRERLNPDSAVERKRRAVEDRHVETWHAPDGMGWLALYGPIEVVESIHIAARNTAQSLKAAGDERTKTQIAADAVIDALMAGFTNSAGFREHGPAGTLAGSDVTGGTASVGTGIRLGAIRPSVNVTVPVQTLMGLSDEPGSLEGYGPIDPETARRLAAQAPTFTRLLTDPESGAVLSVGRKRYTVPADLRRAVEIRDETCNGIGCNRPASRCDQDHTRDWQYGGETDYNNLGSLCKSHHMVRHNTTWQIQMMHDGTFVWTSPLGRRYVIRPNNRPGFAPVPETFERGSHSEATQSQDVQDAPDDDVPF